MIAKYRNFSS